MHNDIQPEHGQHGRRRGEGGFTLVEVLIAIVVLGIGLLGVAKLVMSAIHADDSAYMRGQATQLAYQLLDEMRANRSGSQANDYLQPPVFSNCSAAACTPLQVAQLDLFNWNAGLASTLPSGTGTVAMATDPTADTVATITVSWDDSLAQWAFGTPSADAAPPLMTLTLVSIL